MSKETSKQPREQEEAGRGIQPTLDNHAAEPSQIVVPSEAVTEKLPVLEIDRTEVFAHFQISLISDGKTSPAWVVLLNSDTYFEAHILDQEPSVRNNPIDTNLEDLSHAALRVDQNSIPSEFSQLKIGKQSYTIVGSLPAVVMSLYEQFRVRERIGVNSSTNPKSQKTVSFATNKKPRSDEKTVNLEHDVMRFQLNVPDALASIAAVQFPSQDRIRNGTPYFLLPICNKGEIEAVCLIELRAEVSANDDQLAVAFPKLEGVFAELIGSTAREDIPDVDNQSQLNEPEKNSEIEPLAWWQRMRKQLTGTLDLDQYNLQSGTTDVLPPAPALPSPLTVPLLRTPHYMSWRDLSTAAKDQLFTKYPYEAGIYFNKPRQLTENLPTEPFSVTNRFELPSRKCNVCLTGVDAKHVHLEFIVSNDYTIMPTVHIKQSFDENSQPSQAVKAKLSATLSATSFVTGDKYFIQFGSDAHSEQFNDTDLGGLTVKNTYITFLLPRGYGRDERGSAYNRKASLTVNGSFETLTQDKENVTADRDELRITATKDKAVITVDGWNRVYCSSQETIEALNVTNCLVTIIDGNVTHLTGRSYGTVIAKDYVFSATLFGISPTASSFIACGIVDQLQANDSLLDVYILSPSDQSDLKLHNCQGEVQLISDKTEYASGWYDALPFEIATVEPKDVRYTKHRKPGLKISIRKKPIGNESKAAQIIAALNK